jgi:hypothetical protein
MSDLNRYFMFRIQLRIWLSTVISCVILTSAFLTSAYAQDASAGQFSAGNNQLAIGGGTSSISDHSYLILQGRFGHFIRDGLILEMGMQGWIPLSDDALSIYVLSPGVTGYLYQLGAFVPYAGVFYQYSISELEFEAKSALGARGGILVQQGGSHLGIGVRVTQGVECGESCRVISPEISFMLNF